MNVALTTHKAAAKLKKGIGKDKDTDKKPREKISSVAIVVPDAAPEDLEANQPMTIAQRKETIRQSGIEAMEANGGKRPSLLARISGATRPSQAGGRTTMRQRIMSVVPGVCPAISHYARPFIRSSDFRLTH